MPLPDEAKLHRKTEMLATAQAALRGLNGGGEARRPSNASVLSTERYHGYLPILRQLQAESGGHPRALMTFLKKAYEDDPSSLEQMLKRPARP